MCTTPYPDFGLHTEKRRKCTSCTQKSKKNLPNRKTNTRSAPVCLTHGRNLKTRSCSHCSFYWPPEILLLLPGSRNFWNHPFPVFILSHDTSASSLISKGLVVWNVDQFLPPEVFWNYPMGYNQRWRTAIVCQRVSCPFPSNSDLRPSSSFSIFHVFHFHFHFRKSRFTTHLHSSVICIVSEMKIRYFFRTPTWSEIQLITYSHKTYSRRLVGWHTITTGRFQPLWGWFVIHFGFIYFAIW